MIEINFTTIFNQTLILFLLLVTGFIIKRLKIVDENLNQNLTNLIIYVTLPALVINSMNYEFSRERFANLISVLWITLAVFAGMIAISYLVTRLLSVDQAQKDVYQFILIFANVGFMGYPVIDVIYGAQGIFLAAIYNLVFNVFLWTVGVLIISRSQDEQEGFQLDHLLNPGIFAVGVGFLIFLFSLQLPGPLVSTLEMLGETTTPLSMIVVGSILAQVTLRDIFSNFKLWLITAVRLVGLPLLTLVVLQPLGLDQLIQGVIVVLTGMPAAANTAIFAQEFGGDEALASEGVFLTTLLAMVTIPLLVSLL